MPVEVVGLEIEEDRGSRMELVDVLQLERRDLAHDAAGADDPVELADRAADVSGDGRVQDHAEELARRGLAVRAGDRHELDAGQQPIAELELAPDRHATRTRPCHGRCLARYPRALDHELDRVHQLLVLAAQVDFDAGFGKPPRGELGAPVHAHHAHAPAGQSERGGLSRPGEPDDERGPGQTLHYARKGM